MTQNPNQLKDDPASPENVAAAAALQKRAGKPSPVTSTAKIIKNKNKQKTRR